MEETTVLVEEAQEAQAIPAATLDLGHPYMGEVVDLV
jgi:hypothetical protein